MATDTWVESIHDKYRDDAGQACPDRCDHAACQYARRTGFVYGAPMMAGVDAVARVTAALNDQRSTRETMEGNAR